MRMLMARERFLIGSAGLFGTLAAQAKAAQFEFKCGGDHAADHPESVGTAQMWAAVEQESGGRLKVQFFPNSQLGGDSAMLSQLRVGALHFLFLSPGVISGVVPAANISYVGFAFKDEDEALRVTDGPLGGYIRREIAAKGMYALRSIWNIGMFQVGSNTHPIRIPEDLRGFKLRVVDSRIMVDLFKALGASPVPLSPNEMYTALQTKVIDGEALSLATIETGKFYEVNKYVGLTNHAWAADWMLANADVWKSLPPDLQDIVERNNTRFANAERREVKALNGSVSDKLKSQGIGINAVDPNPFRALLRPYYESWAGAFGSTAWGLLETAVGHKFV